MEFDIEYWIEELNSKVPLKYFKRNHTQYTFVTYINHSIILTKGKHYNGAFMFLKRAGEYLDNHNNIDDIYLISSLDYMKSHFNYLTENKLVTNELIERYGGKLKLTMYKRT